MGQLKDEQTEIDAMRAQLDVLNAERDELRARVEALTGDCASIRNQLLHTQKAYLLQQRELNVLQMEKIEREMSSHHGQ